jgi:hypothetical protein
MTIAQSKDAYRRVNNNLGNGEDTSVILDVPYREWSAIFKPHNLPFLVLPFEYAFALKWWLMAYLLLLSVYWFVLCLLPKRYLLAAAMAVAFLFAPFVQWWYQYITLAPLYYCLFIAAAAMHFVRTKEWRAELLWAGLLSYIAVCFALVLYPPFQIACALALGAFLVGFGLHNYQSLNWQQLLRKGALLLLAGLVTGGIVGLFFITRPGAVAAAQHTAYPGKRVVASGGYSQEHLLSSQLSMWLESNSRASHYALPGTQQTNQSEASNFILLLPLLFLPGIWLMATTYRRKQKLDWYLVTTSLLFLVLLVRLFVPHFDSIFKLLLLQAVPHPRLLIGLGLLSLIHSIILIRHFVTYKPTIPVWMVRIYFVLILLAELWINYLVHRRLPGFVSLPWAIILAFPLPLICYSLLRQRFNVFAVSFAVFSGLSSAAVHPLYHGSANLTQERYSKTIRQLHKQFPGRWAAEGNILESFAIINGAPTLSGLYAYPQLSLWRAINQKGSSDVYNRYAHVSFALDRDSTKTIPTELQLVAADNFVVNTEPCSQFLHDSDVHFLLTTTPLDNQEACVQGTYTVPYPALTLYIYRLR